MRKKEKEEREREKKEGRKVETTRKARRSDVSKAGGGRRLLHFALSYPREDEAVYKAARSGAAEEAI